MISDAFMRLMECSDEEWCGEISRIRPIHHGSKPPTVEEVLVQYIKAKTLGPCTIYMYEKAIRNDLREFATLPITEITSERVLTKYNELLATRKTNTANLAVGVLPTTHVLKRCVPDWLDMRARRITPEMIIERHRQLPHETSLGTIWRVQANQCISTINRLMNYAANNFMLPGGSPLITVTFNLTDALAGWTMVKEIGSHSLI